MAKMNQPGTDRGLKGETGERIPKRATSSDSSGERKVSVPREDSQAGKRGETGERSPSGSKSRDSSGEKKMTITGGVGMGKADVLTGRDSSHVGKQDGHVGEANTGRSDSTVYSHKKEEYRRSPEHYRYGEGGRSMNQPGTEKGYDKE